MGERAGLIAKTPEVKKEISNSRMQKTARHRSMGTSADRIRFLQRTVGNQAVSKLIRSGGLQANLRIGQPGDVYEQEADRVADAVMRMPEPGVQRQVEPEEEEEETLQSKPLASQITPLVQVQRQEEPEEEEEETLNAKPLSEEITHLVQRQVEPEEEEEELQAKATSGRISEVTPNLKSHILSLKGGGQPLSGTERAFFEPRFGADFSHVRIHNDPSAANVARLINARAFTRGRDVVFGNGEYAPGTSSGRRLLAHELAHIIQQRAARSDSNNRIYRKKPKSRPSTLSRAQLNLLRGYYKRQDRILAVQERRISSKREMKHFKKRLIYYIELYEGLVKTSKYLARAMKNVNAVKNTIRALKLISRIKGRLPKKYSLRVRIDITRALSYGPQILTMFLPMLLEHSIDRAILLAIWNNDHFAADNLIEVQKYGSYNYTFWLEIYMFGISYYEKRLNRYTKRHHRETTQLRQLKRQIGFSLIEYFEKVYLERIVSFNYRPGPIFNYPYVILENWKVRPIDLSKPYY